MAFVTRMQNRWDRLDPTAVAQLDFYLSVLTDKLRTSARELMERYTRSGQIGEREIQGALRLLLIDTTNGVPWVNQPNLPIRRETNEFPADLILPLYTMGYPASPEIVPVVSGIYSWVLDIFQIVVGPELTMEGLQFVLENGPLVDLTKKLRFVLSGMAPVLSVEPFLWGRWRKPETEEEPLPELEPGTPVPEGEIDIPDEVLFPGV